MKEKVLITGASGFLGFHLIEAALKKNMDVYAGIRKSSNIEHLTHFPITFTYLDLSNSNSLIKEMEEKNYDYIIHAAGITRAKTQIHYNVVNAEYTFNLALAVLHSGIRIKKFAYISSLAALGPLDSMDEEIDESTKPRPVTHYGKSKLLAEVKLQRLTMPLVILRPTAIYGPRDTNIYIMFKSIKRGLEPYIGKIEQRLSFLYVKDMATATINSLTCPHSGSYNLSDGNSYSRYDFANYLKILMKKKTIKFHLPYFLVKILAKTLEKSGQVFHKTPVMNEDKLNELAGRNWICNIEKAIRELDFNPLYNLNKGLEETLNWYLQYKWL